MTSLALPDSPVGAADIDSDLADLAGDSSDCPVAHTYTHLMQHNVCTLPENGHADHHKAWW